MESRSCDWEVCFRNFAIIHLRADASRVDMWCDRTHYAMNIAKQKKTYGVVTSTARASISCGLEMNRQFHVVSWDFTSIKLFIPNDDPFICYFWVLWRNIYTRDSFWDILLNWYFVWLNVRQNFNRICFIFVFIENPKSNTTLCWPRPESTITAETTSNWALLAVNTSVSAHCQSPTQEIQTSSVHCQKHKANNKFSMRIFCILEFDGIIFYKSRFEK